MDTDWNIPRFAKRLLKNVFINKPKIHKKMCKVCGVCVKVCPANALSMQERGTCSLIIRDVFAVTAVRKCVRKELSKHRKDAYKIFGTTGSHLSPLSKINIGLPVKEKTLFRFNIFNVLFYVF